MKKFTVLLIIMLIFTGAVSVTAEEVPAELLNTLVGAMESDFGLLLDGLGNDIDTILLQNSISGLNIGQAELGSERFNHFYIGLPALGVTVANGFLTFRNDDDYFELLNLNSLLNDMILDKIYEFAGAERETLIDTALDKATPIPGIKGNFGIALPADLELLLSAVGVPAAAMELLPDTVELPGGLSMSYFNMAGVLRYVLLRDSKQTPGVSIGLGGAYNNLALDMDIGDMLSGMLPEIPGDVNPFEDAAVSIGAKTTAFGLDFAMSKKLAVFVPYFKLGAWYTITNVGGEALLMSDDTTTTDKNEEVAISSLTGHNDLDLLVSSGFDLMLGPFCSNIGGDYNLGSGVWSVSLGSRLQF